MLFHWINVRKVDKIPQIKHKINHKIGIYQISPHLNQACPHAKNKEGQEKGYEHLFNAKKLYAPIYMNATKCKMILPTWLKVNQSPRTYISK